MSRRTGFPRGRTALERKILSLRKNIHQTRMEIHNTSISLNLAQVSLTKQNLDILELERELISQSPKIPAPAIKPQCWCCSCVNQSEKHEGCKACWLRSDVQRWIDEKSSDRNQMTEYHGTGFACPNPDRAQCPGWEPK